MGPCHLTSEGGYRTHRVDHRHDGRDRQSVMRCELRINGPGCAKQLARARQVGDIGVGFAGIDRVVGQAFDLRPLDFAVPVSALDQANDQATAAALREINEKINDRWTTLLVSLDHKTDPVPACQCRVEA